MSLLETIRREVAMAISKFLDTGGVYDGTVGWAGSDPHFETQDGITLVKVTLFHGRNVEMEGELPSDGLAHGHQILCRTAGPLHYIPPRKAQVIVLMPAGRMKIPGAGCITALPNESELYADESRFIRIKPDGTIAIFTTVDGTPNGKSVFYEVRPDGFRWEHPNGRGRFDASGLHFTHSSGARIDLGSIGGLVAPLDALNSYVKLAAKMIQLEGSMISGGTTTGVAEPVAKSTSLLTVLGVFQSAISAVGALAALADTDPTKAAAITAASAALGALTTAMTAAPPLVSSVAHTTT